MIDSKYRFDFKKGHPVVKDHFDLSGNKEEDLLEGAREMVETR